MHVFEADFVIVEVVVEVVAGRLGKFLAEFERYPNLSFPIRFDSNIRVGKHRSQKISNPGSLVDGRTVRMPSDRKMSARV